MHRTARSLFAVLFVALVTMTDAVAQTPQVEKPAPKPATPATPGTAARKQPPPPPGPVRPFEFPEYATRKLANGLTVFVIEDHRQPLVSYTLVVNSGGIAHPTERAGLASLTAGLLRRGTTTRSAQQIAQAIDNVGGSLGASAGDDTAQLSASAVKSHADLAIELLADIVLNPTFPQQEIDRIKQQELSGMTIQYSDPEFLAPFAAARVIYGTHPYAYPVDGTPDTLPTITRDEIVAFHKQRYVPAGSFLAVAGDITPEVAFGQVEKHLGRWTGTSGGGVPPSVSAPSGRTVLVIDKPDAVQTQIVVAQRGIPRRHKDYFPLMIANRIVGGEFNSRINLRLRAQEGLTYGARSSLDTLREAGMFTVSTSTRTEETGKALKLILDLLRDFRKNPSTPTEMRETKAYLVGSFAIGSETPGQVAGRIVSAAVHDLGADYWKTYRQKIQSVSSGDIGLAVAHHIDPERMSIIAVGNASAFAKDLEQYGAVRTILFSDIDFLSPTLTKKAVDSR